MNEESEVTEKSDVSVVSEVNEVWAWDLLVGIDGIVLFMYYAMQI